MDKTYYVEIQETLDSEESGMYLMMSNITENDLKHIKRIFGKEFYIIFKQN